ncbi:dTDP-4-dehydrorhamnose 3,5-epimerase [Maricaulis sp. W15]|uniref:dTDP-4-dehydrorhamnose 3,5-epimerase n=1 Tax=Maricaulis maris TaxID=74318 RepID=A0A495DLC2_9PROT|nr:MULTISPECIES: dTDP-4-dehydrorhamnose 3,5-epimerase [Maricaulis]OLF81333.1 dTDP-4-dehydrorhamnose 3,5-epimerase [Maricaulis sp. W15]RKR03733.1 dTDP-4-dehydrorhamnose 3,5-epimerase [Maricaulis maris]
MADTGFNIQSLPLKDAAIIETRRHADYRGYFAVPFNRDAFRRGGITADFLQDNQSLSSEVNTLRGMHCQLPPHDQAKLVRVLQGRITDVLVDARRGSPTFGQHAKQELSAENGLQVFVPRGFLHGFITREPGTLVLYKVDNEYAAGADRSVSWNDPALGIDWGLGTQAPILSRKDKDALSWAEFDTPFRYEAS